ncbi:MAG: hypothetical protein ACTHU0_21875 [Kofleriaceae bacterium]
MRLLNLASSASLGLAVLLGACSTNCAGARAAVPDLFDAAEAAILAELGTNPDAACPAGRPATPAQEALVALAEARRGESAAAAAREQAAKVAAEAAEHRATPEDIAQATALEAEAGEQAAKARAFLAAALRRLGAKATPEVSQPQPSLTMPAPEGQ